MPPREVAQLRTELGDDGMGEFVSKLKNKAAVRRHRKYPVGVITEARFEDGSLTVDTELFAPATTPEFAGEQLQLFDDLASGKLSELSIGIIRDHGELKGLEISFTPKGKLDGAMVTDMFEARLSVEEDTPVTKNAYLSLWPVPMSTDTTRTMEANTETAAAATPATAAEPAVPMESTPAAPVEDAGSSAEKRKEPELVTEEVEEGDWLNVDKELPKRPRLDEMPAERIEKLKADFPEYYQDLKASQERERIERIKKEEENLRGIAEHTKNVALKKSLVDLATSDKYQATYDLLVNMNTAIKARDKEIAELKAAAAASAVAAKPAPTPTPAKATEAAPKKQQPSTPAAASNDEIRGRIASYPNSLVPKDVLASMFGAPIAASTTPPAATPSAPPAQNAKTGRPLVHRPYVPPGATTISVNSADDYDDTNTREAAFYKETQRRKRQEEKELADSIIDKLSWDHPR